MMIESDLKRSLQRLLDAIARADGAVVAEETARLDDVATRGRAGLPPQLVHFLERRSYAKALQFLGGDAAIPAGNCGGGRRGP